MAIADYISPVKKKISLNSDFRKDLLVSPVSFDVVLLKDEEAVKESIKNLILTDRGERLMQPNLGVNLRNILFEQIDEGTIIQIQDIILDALQIWLPFVDVKDIQIDTNDDSKTIDNNSIFSTII